MRILKMLASATAIAASVSASALAIEVKPPEHFATLPTAEWVACTIVSILSDSQSDKVGDKIGIRHNNIHVYTIGDGWFARRNKDFNMTFQIFRGKMMKWTGYADANYGVDKSVTFEAVWTSFGQKNTDGFQLSRYTERVYWGGKEEYRMVSECEESDGAKRVKPAFTG